MMIQNIRSLVLTGAAGLLLSTFSQAELPKSGIPSDEGFPWVGTEQHKKAMQEASARGRRRIASEPEASEDLMSPELKSFRAKFLAAKSADELDELLVQLESKYDTSPIDLKFVAAHVLPIRAFRSIVYRMRPAVEKSKLTHSMLLSLVQQVAAGQSIYLPTDQWRAGFAYLTEPSSGTEKRFKDFDDLQAHLSSKVYLSVLQAARRVALLDLKTKPIAWDNAVLYGPASFVDQLDRYRLVGEAERHASLAGFHATLHNLAAFSAYRAPKFFKLMQDLGRLYGVDAVFWNPVNGVPSHSRVEAIRKHPENFVLNGADGAAWMRRALRHLRESLQYSTVAWNEIKVLPVSRYSVINPALFTPLERTNQLTLDSVNAMVQGRREVRSIVDGSTVVVDLPAFYEQPPQKLQDLLPTAFETAPEYRVKTINGKEVKYRNYFLGQATAWNMAAYKPYFPSLQKSEDVAAAARVLSQSWGGGLIGLPLSILVQ